MRAEGWESLLAAHIEHAPPFAWGTNDCALWSAAWVRKAVGIDLAAGWIGLYDSEEGLQSLLAERGYGSASDIADSCLEPVDVPLAGRGDILLHPSGTLGVCDGYLGHFLTVGGLLRHPTLRCPRAWKVG